MNKRLQKTILAMASRDQKMRKQGPWNTKIDADNTIKLKKIVATYGWPDRKLVGKKASFSAWLIVQHSPDIKFMQKCLKLIEEKIKLGLVDKRNYAYLYDRVQLYQKKPQLFGTQFQGRGGKLVLYKVKDKKNLNKRRKEFGMEPIADYEKIVRASWLRRKKRF